MDKEHNDDIDTRKVPFEQKRTTVHDRARFSSSLVIILLAMEDRKRKKNLDQDTHTKIEWRCYRSWRKSSSQ